MAVTVAVEDRIGLRALVDAYADAVDRHDAQGVAALFSPSGRLVVPDPRHPDRPPTSRAGRDDIAAALGPGLGRYRVLTHVIGGQVLHAGTPVTGVTTCLAHHVYERDGADRLLVMAIRYHDTYERDGERWCFAERSLAIGWRDERPLERIGGTGA